MDEGAIGSVQGCRAKFLGEHFSVNYAMSKGRPLDIAAGIAQKK